MNSRYLNLGNENHSLNNKILFLFLSFLSHHFCFTFILLSFVSTLIFSSLSIFSCMAKLTILVTIVLFFQTRALEISSIQVRMQLIIITKIHIFRSILCYFLLDLWILCITVISCLISCNKLAPVPLLLDFHFQL